MAVAICGPVGRITSSAKAAYRPARSTTDISIPLNEGTVFGAAGLSWRVAYNGYGHVAQTERSGVTRITLTAARAALPADTHAALVLSRRNWRDVTAEIRVRTTRQLRSPHPNPWEVGWTLWHYVNDQHFYDVVLEPIGCELGKRGPSIPT